MARFLLCLARTFARTNIFHRENHEPKILLGHIGALSLAASAVHAETFQNGGFENGIVNGWTTGGGNCGHTLNASLWPGQLLPSGSLYAGPATRSDIIAAGTVDPIIGVDLGSTVKIAA